MNKFIEPNYSNMLILPEYYKGVESTISFNKVELSKRISPRMLFEFAQLDLNLKPKAHAMINALSNAKRALHFQIDIITKSLGIMKLPHNQRDNFNKKLLFCKKCGIISPPILQKLNRLRNSMEHDCLIPKSAQVQDFIDIVALFLLATDKLVHQFPGELDFIYSRKSKITLPDIQQIYFPIGEGIIYLCYNNIFLKDELREAGIETIDQIFKKYSIKITPISGDLFYSWVKFIIKFSYKF